MYYLINKSDIIFQFTFYSKFHKNCVFVNFIMCLGQKILHKRSDINAKYVEHLRNRYSSFNLTDRVSFCKYLSELSYHIVVHTSKLLCGQHNTVFTTSRLVTRQPTNDTQPWMWQHARARRYRQRRPPGDLPR